MAIHYLNTGFTPVRRGPAPRAFFAFGFWLRAGFVALSVAAIALVMLANGEAGALTAIPSVISGICIATFAWHRAWVLIERLEPSEPAAEAAPARPRPARFGAFVEAAATR